MASLMAGSTESTQVAYFDSLAVNPDGVAPNIFWAHLMLQAWTALDGRHSELGLCLEKPSLEDMLARLDIVRPKVIQRNHQKRTWLTLLHQVRVQANDVDCGLHAIRNAELFMQFREEAVAAVVSPSSQALDSGVSLK